MCYLAAELKSYTDEDGGEHGRHGIARIFILWIAT